MDIVDVSPPEDLVREVVPGRRRSGVGDSFGALLWLLTAAGVLSSSWLPITSELNQYPAEYGVPSGFIRTSADGWGRLQATHSSFEGPLLGSGAPRYGIWLALCAVAFAMAALGSRWPRIVSDSRTIGGTALLLTGGSVLSIRLENLPREPIEADPGATWQFGWGLWLMTFALLLGALAWARTYVRATRVIAFTAARQTPSRWRALGAVLGSALIVALLVGAGIGRAFDVTVVGRVNGRITRVRYSFDGWGRSVVSPRAPTGLAESIAHYAPFAARDAIPVSFICAVLLIAGLCAIRSRIDYSHALRVAAGTLVGGMLATQLTVAMWMRSSVGSSGGGRLALGPSMWFLLAAAAVAWTPLAFRAWDRRIPRRGPNEDSTGLDLLS